MRTRTPGRAGRVLQNALVVTLTVVLLAIAVVLVPGVMPASLRSALGIDTLRSVVAADAGSYKFLDIQPGTKQVPISYDGCQPLHYVVNFAGAPERDAKASYVFDAVAEISEASGLDFVYDGTSDRRPSREVWMTGGQILIAFADPEEVPDMATASGRARSHPVRGREFTVYASGQVTLNSDSFDRILNGVGGYDRARAIVMHELGHVLGLDHVNDKDEIMHGGGTRATELGPGDRTGLKILGSGPCL